MLHQVLDSYLLSYSGAVILLLFLLEKVINNPSCRDSFSGIIFWKLTRELMVVAGESVPAVDVTDAGL